MIRPIRAPARAGLAAALAVAACGGEDVTRIAIELEVPADDAGGALLADLESLEFRVSDGDFFVSSQLYRVDDGVPAELLLPSVPDGSQVLFDLSGTAGGALVAYGRTCRVTVEPGVDDVRARLYFSRVGRFRPGQDPIEPARAAALTFSDGQGRAFVTGGSIDPVMELFDPRVGEFRAAGEVTARAGGALAVRPDGTVVVAGGRAPDGGELVGAVDVIAPGSAGDDPTVGQLTQGESEASRRGLALVALPDLSVLLAGGRTEDGRVTDGIAVLADGDDRFRAVAAMAEPRTEHTASIGQGDVVYLIGGVTRDEEGERASGSIERYRDDPLDFLPVGLATPRFGHTATVLADGRILVVGGKTPRPAPCGDAAQVDPETCFDPVASVELFDPILGTVEQLQQEIPGGVYDHTATVVAGGRVLIAGGFGQDGAPTDRAWLFDPQVEALVPTRELFSPRARHTAAELCDGTVLLVGGDSIDGSALSSERYIPAPDRQP